MKKVFISSVFFVLVFNLTNVVQAWGYDAYLKEVNGSELSVAIKSLRDGKSNVVVYVQSIKDALDANGKPGDSTAGIIFRNKYKLTLSPNDELTIYKLNIDTSNAISNKWYLLVVDFQEIRKRIFLKCKINNGQFQDMSVFNPDL